MQIMQQSAANADAVIVTGDQTNRVERTIRLETELRYGSIRLVIFAVHLKLGCSCHFSLLSRRKKNRLLRSKRSLL
jgi:hypothetical protein